ncbi:FAD dependent oxidoreductase [Stanieria cyanosphaera PCC 7437]|uniref:FAD dependent oxidoreductase n=1 Tax=Stanieria cyanosphaera (strain ATCC 29371 / PCC 7437) TaxID=111780 RepID=K9Y055_STAC7|nr:FAD-dependent oxidoreductase [Stanieria cyanosphaera]AFZ37766.1 FAD dependent oxidoreductase [Stanieria cyanosphaera PCC 7437]
MGLSEQILAQRNDGVWERLQSADRFWNVFRKEQINPTEAVNVSNESLGKTDWDLVICGGTLGILLGAACTKLGWRVALIERGILKGREQEWNISRQELQTFIELELLTESELNQAIATEYNPARIGFLGGEELWVKDVLNIGVDPVFLLAKLKEKFLQAGGQLLEQTPFTKATVYNDGVLVEAGEFKLTTGLLVDGMGHFSPIVKQARKGIKPEGICVVVGSCAEGYQENSTGDLIYSFTPIINQCQYFWEAFPARDGRTTYMFSYLDAEPARPNLEWFMDEYLRLLPQYQNIELSQLDFKRFLFGFFPAYRQSPLHLTWNRILTIGDSSGSQSPVSFGGFGAMVRHLQRLTSGIDEAIKSDCLKSKDLALLQPYQPNISVTWLFQKTMSVGINEKVNLNQINDLMNGVFAVMNHLGDDVLKPFLQDVIQFAPLARTLPLVNPKLVLPILPKVGINGLLDWSIHYLNLALYSGFYPLGKSIQPLVNYLSPTQQYYYHRWLDAWKYGSGGDFHVNKY